MDMDEIEIEPNRKALVEAHTESRYNDIISDPMEVVEYADWFRLLPLVNHMYFRYVAGKDVSTAAIAFMEEFYGQMREAARKYAEENT